MKVLVTGSKGFMGKHLTLKLKDENIDFFSYDLNNTENELIDFVSKSDFIIHLAGVMRPLSNDEFYDANSNLTKKLIDIVLNSGRKIPILLASSTQAVLDNDYGITKKMCEDYLFKSGLPSYVFRFTNAFGKWGKPNYNSVASTFMYNIAHNLDIFIRDPNFNIHFIYIDDIINTMLDCIMGKIKPSNEILSIYPVHDCTIGHLADLLYNFKDSIIGDGHLPSINDDFELKLFTSFCDYFSDEGSKFDFTKDNNGSFEQIFKSDIYGEIRIYRIMPGSTLSDIPFNFESGIIQLIKGNCSIQITEKCSNKLLDSNPILIDKININKSMNFKIQNNDETESVLLFWNTLINGNYDAKN